ncbi:tudor domain-containing protein 7 isoform X1 [Pelobates fuscus]|uniref:tudor domain-containing protein 7 isoform X1 n=2 Tax=Pelobates fuscus TaxID=191477 RepID=UPI002FE43019
MLESEKDLVAKMLRAVLQSNKNGVPLTRLAGEYKSLTGEIIPFKEMGFYTLETYLKSIPGVVKIDINRVGEATCYAVVCKETAHVAELVARQRSSKKKSGGQVNCQMRIKYSAPITHIGKPKATLRKPGFSSPQEKNLRKPAPLTLRGKGTVYSGRPIYDTHPPLLAAPAYGAGLIRDIPMQKPPPLMNRSDRKVILPPRFQKEGPYLLPTPTMDANANETHGGKPAIGNLHPNLTLIQNNLRELFSKYSNGIWISKLPQVYKENFKQEIGDEVLKLIPSWSHLCTAQKIVNSGQTEMILFPSTRKQQTTSKSPPQRNSDQVKLNASSSLAKPTTPTKLTVGAISDVELKPKISEILNNYSNGLWSHALPKVFEDTFKKKFPNEVLQNLESLSDICTVDIICENPYKAILYAKTTSQDHQNMNVSGSSSIPQAVSNVQQDGAEKQSATEDLIEECDLDLTPPKLVIPSEASPSVLVVELNSTNEVVIRYVGQDYSAAQERMEDDMKEFYSKTLSPGKVGSLKVGQLVAVKAEEEAWLRAQIYSVDDNKVKVCYVDYGFSEVIEHSKVRRLDRSFYTLPFQASKCKLAGLEAFCDEPVLVKAVETKACGKILAVEILQKTEKPLVVLYDTSGDDDVNINATCLREWCDKSLNVQLRANATYTNVIVTNVCSDGTLFCQVPSKGLGKLCETLQKINAEFNSKHVTSDLFVSLPFCGKICLFHCKGKWARVEITSVHSSRALDVKFLDSGTIASVKVSELREIPPQFLRDIFSISPQALRCCLADLPLNIGTWTPDAVLWLRNTVLNCSECSIKVEKIDETSGMVHVFLFASKNCLDPEKSINRLITNEELWKNQKDVFININPGLGSSLKGRGDAGSHPQGLTQTGSRKEQSTTTKRPLEDERSVSPSLDLPPPLQLPKPGEHMDVFVSVACHPGHFVFQPWQELHKLEVVMEEMLLHYSTTEEKPVVVEKNKLYAAKVDNKWYRVVLKGILTNGLVSVYELDYGRHELISCRKVQPLIEKFRQLPFQAVTSQLAGVKCEQWSEEASIVFRNHVEQKPLVALVQSVIESTNSWDRKVVAYIVDTSMPDTDIWVHNLMSEYLVQLS